jgi:hypothetical protein
MKLSSRVGSCLEKCYDNRYVKSKTDTNRWSHGPQRTWCFWYCSYYEWVRSLLQSIMPTPKKTDTWLSIGNLFCFFSVWKIVSEQEGIILFTKFPFSSDPNTILSVLTLSYYCQAPLWVRAASWPLPEVCINGQNHAAFWSVNNSEHTYSNCECIKMHPKDHSGTGYLSDQETSSYLQLVVQTQPSILLSLKVHPCQYQQAARWSHHRYR